LPNIRAFGQLTEYYSCCKTTTTETGSTDGRRTIPAACLSASNEHYDLHRE
jgi:hypothetical protein